MDAEEAIQKKLESIFTEKNEYIMKINHYPNDKNQSLYFSQIQADCRIIKRKLQTFREITVDSQALKNSIIKEIENLVKCIENQTRTFTSKQDTALQTQALYCQQALI
jgi:hypothetical protein